MPFALGRLVPYSGSLYTLITRLTRGTEFLITSGLNTPFILKGVWCILKFKVFCHNQNIDAGGDDKL